MMLRNMFDAVATEGTLRQLLRQLTFPRTITDVLRVNVDNSPQATIYSGNTNSSMAGAVNQPAHWGAVSWNTVDARYAFGEQQVLNYIQNRERWTFS